MTTININYYGHSVDLDPQDVADQLGNDATAEEIKRKLNEMIEEAVEENQGIYSHDGDDLVEEVQALLKAAAEEENEEDSDDDEVVEDSEEDEIAEVLFDDPDAEEDEDEDEEDDK